MILCDDCKTKGKCGYAGYCLRDEGSASGSNDLLVEFDNALNVFCEDAASDGVMRVSQDFLYLALEDGIEEAMKEFIKAMGN